MKNPVYGLLDYVVSEMVGLTTEEREAASLPKY